MTGTTPTDLLAWASTSAVVDNAPAELKRQHRVVASHDEGGVAELIERYVLACARWQKPQRHCPSAACHRQLDLSHYRSNASGMSLARSKITAQGQISVPAKVRKKLGVGPGSILVWDEEGGRIVVRRAGAYTSEEIHAALFPKAPGPKSLKELDEGIREHLRKKHEGR